MNGIDLTVDNNKNIYVVGTTLDPHLRSIVLMKADSAGNQLWNRTWSGFNASMGKEITMDNEGNIFILGKAYSYPKELARPIKNYLVLIKWDSFGNQLWNRTWEVSSKEGGFGIDNEGYIYTMNSISDWAHYFMLIKWDTAGNQLWNRTWGDSKSEHRFLVGNVVVDTHGFIYTVGTQYSLGMKLVKWDSAGNQLWNRTWKQFDFNYGRDVAVDNHGNIYTVGGTEYWDQQQYNKNTLLVKWDPAGNQLWNISRDVQSTTRSNTRIGIIERIVTSSTGSIYGVGRLIEALFPSIYYTYLLVMKWDATGNYRGIKIWKETCSSAGSGITINNEKIYCIGETLVVIFSVTGFSDLTSISTPAGKCYPRSLFALFLKFIEDLFIIPIGAFIVSVIFVSLVIKKVKSNYLTKKTKLCDEL
ncbi:MAG: hypothetical protein ACFFBD_06230, partial [Candidatus Hodarchaeota archaeon]